MSEQEIKDQIERDAKGYADNFVMRAHQRTARKSYLDAYTIATNRTVEAAIKHIRSESWRFDSDDDMEEIIKELEKMRRV